MCNCISELEKKLIGMEWKKKKVIKVEFVSAMIDFQSGSLKTMSEVEAMLEGGKKPIKIPIVHSHCPMCGKAYRKEQA